MEELTTVAAPPLGMTVFVDATVAVVGEETSTGDSTIDTEDTGIVVALNTLRRGGEEAPDDVITLLDVVFGFETATAAAMKEEGEEAEAEDANKVFFFEEELFPAMSFSVAFFKNLKGEDEEDDIKDDGGER